MTNRDSYSVETLASWIALLEIFSDSHSLLQGAAGEDAMSVGDVLGMVRELKRLRSMYDEATEIQGDEEVLRYVKSGNAIPVTRCTVSADLIRQLISARNGPLDADAKRLDFIEEKAATVYCSLSGHWVFVEERGKRHDQRRGIIGKTLREAIDNASPATNGGMS